MRTTSLIERGTLFKHLHEKPGTFLMPNAWDAGSAALLAAFDFSAIATTSAGICFSLAQPDSEAAVSRDAMLARVSDVVSAVSQPVNADLQSGYGRDLSDVERTIELAVAAGAVGANIEDSTGNPQQPLLDTSEAVARIRAARAAADRTGIPFVLTARTDTFLVGVDSPFEEAVNRCNAYREAGADCLFVPGASELSIIRSFVEEINGPLNVVVGLVGSAVSVQQLSDLGVRRISLGGSLARAAYGLVRRAAEEMSTQGTFSYASTQIPDAELCTFFQRLRET